VNERHRPEFVTLLARASLRLVDSTAVDFLLDGVLADEASEEGCEGLVYADRWGNMGRTELHIGNNRGSTNHQPLDRDQLVGI
jgi:hypothetical protein